MTRAMRRHGGDGGFTLVETLVATALVTVLLGIASSAFIAASRSLGRTDDESSGLADVKTVVERLSRDVLASRGVDPSSSNSSLTLWIDYNSNYKQTANETITWTISPNPADPDHFLVQRADGTGATKVEGRALVSDIAFTYDSGVPSATTRTVSVSMEYDALAERASSRRVEFIARLRNVE